jgi:hypothetical protein
MPRSSGTYTLPAGNPVVTGTTITSTWANTTFSDVATALTGSVATDGTSPMTGILQMGNNRITGVADGTAATDVATVNQISNPTITGGTIDGAPIGAANPKNGAFLALSATTAAFSGTSTAPTVTPASDNSTKIATTAFVQSAISAISSGVTSFNTRSGAVTLISADVTTALGYTPYNAGGATVITTSNISTYAPTVNGTGAYGTWGISISGNAATATTATNATTVTNGIYTNVVNTLTGSGSITATGTSIGDQRIGVTGAGYSSGLAPAALQMGTAGVGFNYNGTLLLGLNGGTGAAWSLATNGDFTINGTSAVAYKPGGGSWTASSDSRLKENVTALTGALSKITSLNPVNYTWKYQTNEPTVGFIAQEVLAVLPSAVSETTPTETQKQYITDNKLYAIGWQNDMTAYLVGAIKELKAIVDAQAAEIAALKG